MEEGKGLEGPLRFVLCAHVPVRVVLVQQLRNPALQRACRLLAALICLPILAIRSPVGNILFFINCAPVVQ